MTDICICHIGLAWKFQHCSWLLASNAYAGQGKASTEHKSEAYL